MTYFRLFHEATKRLYAVSSKNVTFLIIASLILLILVPVELNIVKTIVDTIQAWKPGQDISPLIELTLYLTTVLIVARSLLGTAMGLATTRVHEIGKAESLALVLAKSIRLPLLSLESPQTKDIHQRAAKIDMALAFLNGLEWYRTCAQLLVLLAIITFQGHWAITAGMAVFLVIQLLIYSRTTEDVQVLLRQQIPQRRLLTYLSELITNKKAGRELRVFNSGGYFDAKWRHLFAENSNQLIRKGVKTESIKAIPDLSIALMFGLVAVGVMVLIGQEKRTAGDFALFFQATVMLFELLPDLVSTYSETKTISIHWADFAKYQALSEDDQTSTAVPASPDLISLHVENVSFQYPDSQAALLKDISFTLKAGTSMAIIGENGSGKSTLIKLLLGLYRPQHGQVNWLTSAGYKTSDEISGMLSVIYQDFAKYYLTVRENVAISSIAELDNDSVLAESLERAAVDHEVLDLDVQLGPSFGGVEPSGGQWQRLAAARAYGRDSKCIIVDEPTASLDPKTEKAAFEHLLNSVKGQSAILVTHRLGGARLADWIIVIKDGQLVEQGTHQDLIKMGGEYQRLYDLQSAWYQ